MLVVISQLSIGVSCDGTYELSCATDTDCSDHFGNKVIIAKCQNKLCQCRDTMLNVNITCKPQKLTVNNKIGNNCNVGCQMPNARCDTSQNKCVCKNGFRPTSDSLRCLSTIVPLKQPCESNDQCVSFDQFSACENKTCTCLTNFTQHENECRSMVKMGEKCVSNEECQKITDNGVCVTNKCVCQKEYVASADGNNCLKSGYNGDKCTEINQCLVGLGVGSICSSGMCVCDENHKPIKDGNKTICKRIINIGDTCKEHSDCYIYLEKELNMDCIQGSCACRDEYEEIDNSCYKKNSSSKKVTNFSVIIIMAFITYAIAK
ncbi:unnamed protein product [Diamesa serratosioi]